MKQSKRSLGWKQMLCAAAAIALLIAACLAASAMIGCSPASTQTAEQTAEVPAETTIPTAEAAETAAPIEATTEPTETNEPPMGYIPDDEVVFNRFLTAIVQQNIENSQTDLDEDSELVRFVFGYRDYYEKESILEQEDADGTPCRTLTLEQVNETLDYFFGRTISPDREDYTIPIDESESFRCVYSDGCFRNVSPYPTSRYDFPVRFALVDRINQKTNTLHFRLYRMNPDAGEDGEAERHVPIMPMMSIYEAEFGNDATKTWITKIGEGTAVLSDLGGDLQLVELKSKFY